jgi:predicted phage-related endonuclease
MTALPTTHDSDAAFRKSVVGASQVAALFDKSPWLTEFELWHQLKGTIDTPEFATDERQQAGVRMESAIVDWACDKWGYTKIKTPQRVQIGHLGGHPDQLAHCPERGLGVLEVKTVDRLMFRDWGEEPPLHYQLQAVTYAGLTGLKWADLIVLVGGNQLERFQIEARPALFETICAKVEAFWQSIEEGRAPLPDFARDRSAIAEICRDLSVEEIDLTADNLAPEACREYLAAHADEKAAAARKEAAQAEIMFKLSQAAGAGDPVKRVVATMPGFRATATLIDAIPDRAATEGEIIKGRKAYRRLSIKETTDVE